MTNPFGRDARTRRRARAEAKAVLADSRVRQRRSAHKLSSDARAQLETSRDALQTVLNDAASQPAALTAATQRLQVSLQRHLADYGRPGWLENLESVGYAVVVALVLRAFVVEAFKIPSGSMIPTLAVGDQIFVNKFLYGPRLPYFGWRPVRGVRPKRGEVVVFVCPVEPHEDFIKRIIAIEGDEVAVRAGVVYVNGAALPRRSLGETSHWDKDTAGQRWLSFRANAYEEKLGEHTFVALQDAEMGRRAPDFGPHVVPLGHVFMMGDNRDHSYDSRAWGPVPEGNILGRSMFVWWSWGQEGLRPSRLGTWLE